MNDINENMIRKQRFKKSVYFISSWQSQQRMWCPWANPNVIGTSLVDTHISALYCNHNLHIYSVNLHRSVAILFCQRIWDWQKQLHKNGGEMFSIDISPVFLLIFGRIFCQSDIRWQNKITIVIANLELPVLAAHVFYDWHKWVYNNLPVPITSSTQCTPNSYPHQNLMIQHN